MDSIFFYVLPVLEPILRIALATVMGAAIGYERERADKPAGFRTHALVCLGAALFTLASIGGFGIAADPSRVAAGIVTGVGFLGAGTILRRGEARPSLALQRRPAYGQ